MTAIIVMCQIRCSSLCDECAKEEVRAAFLPRKIVVQMRIRNRKQRGVYVCICIESKACKTNRCKMSQRRDCTQNAETAKWVLITSVSLNNNGKGPHARCDSIDIDGHRANWELRVSDRLSGALVHSQQVRCVVIRCQECTN